MKRKEKELYWTEQISDYRQSGESLVQWCEKKDIKPLPCVEANSRHTTILHKKIDKISSRKNPVAFIWRRVIIHN